MKDTLQAWAKRIKRDLHALYLAGRDPRVPWYVKLLVVATAAYALSPIDLIPDFIPVIGYLDDVLLVPLGIYLAVKLIPPQVMEECRDEADRRQDRPPVSRTAAGLVLLVWAGVALLVTVWIWRLFAA
ncbi:YkvA family protein [Roseibium sp. FZY0029]|uniref:YkvA family protein n=1 Tax=Roseibium sp. FZY0029 TaxID=3116647 RepID=UPI002EB38651|nr:YkvA family protein [Roseibium sp. FZY0029]